MEHVVSGINGAAASNLISRAQGGGVDASALLNGIAKEQESGKGGNNAPGLDQIIGGLAGQNLAGGKNQSASGEREQAKQKEEPQIQDPANAQQSKGNGLAIQIEQTTVKEANGQERNGVRVDQNERKRPNEETNPLKRRLRRGSCYLTGSDKSPVFLCFQDGTGFRAWPFTRLLARHPRLMGWFKPYYERVELPAVTLLGFGSQESLAHGKAHALCDRQDRKRLLGEVSSFTMVWPAAGVVRFDET